MLNKSVNPYLKIMNFPPFRLEAFHRAAMNLIAALLPVRHNFSEKLILFAHYSFSLEYRYMV